MTKGVAYERFVQSDATRACPNCLTEDNFRQTKNVNSQGWSYQHVTPLIGRTLPQLERIPLDADLFATSEFDGHVVNLISELVKTRGIQFPNATKLLYQKRPGLIPIFDDLARRAMGFYWIKSNEEAALFGLKKFRELGNYGRNREALTRLQSWLASEPRLTGGLTLSRLRILDILAWGLKSQATP
jgi:hypothetical protein